MTLVPSVDSLESLKTSFLLFKFKMSNTGENTIVTTTEVIPENRAISSPIDVSNSGSVLTHSPRSLM